MKRTVLQTSSVRLLCPFGRKFGFRPILLGLERGLTHSCGQVVYLTNSTQLHQLSPLTTYGLNERSQFFLNKECLLATALIQSRNPGFAFSRERSQSTDPSNCPYPTDEKSLCRNSSVPIESLQRFTEDLAGLEYNEDDQQKKTNLGAMMDQLKISVPRILQESLPGDILLENVLLRVCPSHFDRMNAYLPNIKGHVSYYATCKAIRLYVTSLVLNPKTQLHIQLIRTSRFLEPNCVYGHSTKIYIRWTTCPEGCWHLSGSTRLVAESHAASDTSTANATLGSHRWSSIDAGKLLDKLDHNWSLTGALANLGKGIVGLRKEEQRLERVISGIFIFELNEANDKILVHTIEDMDVEERSEEESELGIC